MPCIVYALLGWESCTGLVLDLCTLALGNKRAAIKLHDSLIRARVSSLLA